MASSERVETLKARHADLESKISLEMNRPAPDDGTVATLKRQKLRLKEEIQRMSA